jgi:hypothetical protein
LIDGAAVPVAVVGCSRRERSAGLTDPHRRRKGDLPPAGPECYPGGRQQFADRVAGLAGEEFDVVCTDPARYVQFLGRISAEPGGDGEPLPYRPARWHRGRPCRASACCTSGSLYRAVMSSISVGPGEGRAAYADGQALVVGGAEHHPAGHAEELADLAGGQPSPQVHVGQDVRLDGEPVFPVEPSPGSQSDAVGAEPVLDGPGRNLGQANEHECRG